MYDFAGGRCAVLYLIAKHCFAVWMTLPSGWWMPTCMLLFCMLLSLAVHHSSASQELCCKRPRMPSFLSPVTTSSRVSVSVAVALCKHTQRVAQESKLLILWKLRRHDEQIRTTIGKMKHFLIFAPEIFTVWCTLVLSAVLRLHVVPLYVCLSVWLSVTLVDYDHISWKTWKLIDGQLAQHLRSS